jgi:hypothetical protein
MTLSTTTLIITTIGIMGFFATLSISVSVMLSVVKLNVIVLSVVAPI